MFFDQMWNGFPRLSADGWLFINDQSAWREEPTEPIRAYYLFVEHVSSISNFEHFDAPNGYPLKVRDAKFERPQTRFRASGVGAVDFTRREESFTGDLSRRSIKKQRAARRGQLEVYFQSSPVRLFDFYVDSADREAQAIAATLLPTSWHLIVLDQDPTPLPGRQVFHCSTQRATEEDYDSDRLRWIMPVRPAIERRLRDIFSLNHIGDADLGAGGTEPTPGRPPPPEPEFPEALDEIRRTKEAIARLLAPPRWPPRGRPA